MLVRHSASVFPQTLRDDATEDRQAEGHVGVFEVFAFAPINGKLGKRVSSGFAQAFAVAQKLWRDRTANKVDVIEVFAGFMANWAKGCHGVSTIPTNDFGNLPESGSCGWW